ncbi:DUF2169 family type VI secretion system accessory protein [Roseateles amylovorans]|uniref:DUF2169 domain-containing protein n=1 Tax=Roseateles amylovorans TaxID=2978473 RepID=A0ABY6B5L8_9BURK|nr:DUF2169 domain-containing protein [Roseateles amylovorans]UXH80658.1 DUF2169 domain-containing protein [Roseateles amylovorans]
MKFTNATPYSAGWTLGFQRDGRERLVAIVKATFRMPRDATEPVLQHETQRELIREDQFIGEPGLSAPTRETDFAHAKPACDVLVLGHAHAPAGTRVRRLVAGMRVGDMTKQIAVVGDRHWHQSLVGGVNASDPQPFREMSLGYERAFGGTDSTALPRTGQCHSLPTNPVGRGYWRFTDHLEGQPLPNLEEVGQPVTRHDGAYRPMAFTPVGRQWAPRHGLAGTYDARWLEEQAPFWPNDFDERYFQAAPLDQQIPYPQGGEPVVLQHLTPDGRRAFALPRLSMPVTFIPYRCRDITRQAVLDTLVFEPDEDCFTATWRAGLALGKSVFDVKEILTGDMSEAWYRARRFPNKTYHRSLAEAVAARRGGRS